MPEIFDIKKISSILKQLKATEKFFSLNLFKTVKRALRSSVDPIKKLREDIYKNYQLALNDNSANGELALKKFAKFVEQSQESISKTVNLLTDGENRKKTFRVRRRLNLLKELSEEFLKFDSKIKGMEDLDKKINNINNQIVNSQKYEKVKGIKGLVVFRQKIQHGIGLSDVLDKVTQLKYELIVALTGETIEEHFGKDEEVKTIPNRQTYCVANVKIKLPQAVEIAKFIMNLIPVVKRISDKVKLDINICVYITFLGGLMPIAGKFLNLKSQLKTGLINNK